MISHILLQLAVADPNVTKSWLFPEQAEIIYGGLSSVIVIGGLIKFAGPMAKKAMVARTAKIQKQLDDAANALTSSSTEAVDIRAALGDIASERARMMAEADVQSAAVLVEGRVRVAAEVAELEAKAAADLNAARGRSSDELRAEITMLASIATPIVVQATLNDQTKNELIESFISSVGAGR